MPKKAVRPMPYAVSEHTKAMLCQALKKKMAQKPLDKITIRELADDCGLKRQAFYYHFQDIYDLLDKWLDRKKNQFFAMTQLTGSWTDRLKVLLHAMQENPKLVYHVSDSITRERLERYVFTSIESQFYDLIGEKTAAMEITDETRKMMTSFFCCSLLGYVMKFLWVNMNVDIDASVDDLSIIFSGALEAMLRKEMGQQEP